MSDGLPRESDRLVRTRALGLVVILAAVAARATVLSQMVDTVHFANPTLDALTNWTTAQQWAVGDGPERPFFKAPLYPWLLGQVTRTADPLTENQAQIMAIAIVIQLMMGIALAFIVWRVTCSVAGVAAGLVAGLACALAGASIFFETELLDTAVVTFLLMAGMATLVGTPPPLGWRRLVAAGALLGLSVIARPTALAPVAVAIMWCLAVHMRRGSGLWCAIGSTALLATPTGLLIVCVAWANGFQTPIATYGGPNFWLANNPSADGFTTRVPQIHGVPREGEDYIERFALREAAVRLGREEVSRTEADTFWRREGLRHWRDHPDVALRATGKRALLFWQGPEIKNNKSLPFVGEQIPALGWLMRLVNWRWLAPLGLIGLWIAGRVARPGSASAVTLIGLTVIALFLAGLPFPVNTRYRLPALPFLCIGAGVAVAALVGAIQERRWGRLAVIAGWAVGLAALCHLDWTGGVAETERWRDWWQLGNLATQRGNVEAGDLELAEEAYQRALELNPGHFESQLNLARVWILGGDTARALEALTLLHESDSHHPGVWTLTGQAHLIDERPEEAEAALREALRLDPTYEPALEALGLLHKGR